MFGFVSAQLSVVNSVMFTKEIISIDCILMFFVYFHVCLYLYFHVHIFSEEITGLNSRVWILIKVQRLTCIVHPGSH